MKALVIGASGFLGGYLSDSLQRRGWEVTGTYHRHPYASLKPLDICDPNALEAFFSKYTPDVICICAAEPNVDYCEEHPSETAKINVQGVENVAAAAVKIKAKLVYFSSDYVFDGEAGPYQETDSPHPVSEYGGQKLKAETLIQKIIKDHLILRVTVLYGWERQGKNFLERLLRALKSQEKIRVPNDQIGTPTLIHDAAEMTAELLSQKSQGIFHVAGPEMIDRYHFALEAARVFNLPADPIAGVTTAELQQKAKRPLKAGLRSQRLRGIISYQPKGVSEGLAWLKANPKKEE